MSVDIQPDESILTIGEPELEELVVPSAMEDSSDSTDNQALSIYFREIARHPLLTAEEEVRLAQELEAGEEARRALAAGTGPRAQLEAAVALGEAARRRLIECNLRLVVAVARKYVSRGLPLPDLIQEGNIGLHRAAEKFDWRKGYRFSTYAYWWIRQAVSRAIADQSRTIRLPVHIGEFLSDVARAQRALSATLDREPTAQELALYLEVPTEKVEEALRAARVPLSLEDPVGEDSDATRGDLLADEREEEALEAAVEQHDLRELLERVLDRLEPRERAVLRWRFGLDGERERTLSEVGEALGVSRERVRQIEAEALRKLRRPEVRRWLSEYLN